ncbi:ClbS/DfsB family four-helix bundle protein [Afifella sp. YEN Y35]|uniref:ClbS/DfsB family four-helix bundle protein n=1 Tax=Afifella sp. YEN Y35 TaxID=3388337 RepID=UPI0039E0EAB0
MAVPTNKDELLKAIDLNFDKLIKDLRGVPRSLVDECSLEGHARGTQMSVADLVAYLVGWNELVLKWLDRDAAGEPVDFPETGFKWNELGRLAQKFYRDYEGVPYPQLIERLAEAKARIVALIEARNNDDLYGHPWYEKWTMGRMIQFNTASPYANARGRLRTWLKTKNVSRQS